MLKLDSGQQTLNKVRVRTPERERERERENQFNESIAQIGHRMRHSRHTTTQGREREKGKIKKRRQRFF